MAPERGNKIGHFLKSDKDSGVGFSHILLNSLHLTSEQWSMETVGDITRGYICPWQEYRQIGGDEEGMSSQSSLHLPSNESSL